MEKAVSDMVKRIVSILDGNAPSIYLYGSVALGDFKFGWSDIDILVLTRHSIAQEQAEKLVCLRQTMLSEKPGNPYYRSFEGGMLSMRALFQGDEDLVVYWGTSGQCIKKCYELDAFSMCELLDDGILLHGEDVRARMRRPDMQDLQKAVRRHYETIRQYAQNTGPELYSYGWLLDISRCIYTLRTGKIIAKTAAGDWALQENLCPCADVLRKAVAVRKEPAKFLRDENTMLHAQTLGNFVQAYADVLEWELERHM